jgi:NADH pyrophosphatase NudC (nudix superfamily)
MKCGSKCEDFEEGGILRQRCPECGYIHYKNPYPCIAVLVVNDAGEILLGKRHADSIYPGKWCLPCGYIEYDETYMEAAAREVKEEMGITSPPEGIVNVVSNMFDNGVHSLVAVLISYYHGNEPLIPGDDIIEAGWFHPDDMEQWPELAFSADKFIIQKYINMLAEGGITTLTPEGNCNYGH